MDSSEHSPHLPTTLPSDVGVSIPFDERPGTNPNALIKTDLADNRFGMGMTPPQPEPTQSTGPKKFCSECGAIVTGKFCTECGAPTA